MEDREPSWTAISPAALPEPVARLAAAVRQADGRALLVLPRILRRIIKEDRHLGGFGIRVPHRKSYWIDSPALLEIVEKGELGLAADDDVPAKVILLAQPDPRKLSTLSTGDLLIRYWRLLLHARVHLALDQQRDQGKLSAAVVRRRIHEIGLTQFEEIRGVLRQEGFLLPPSNEETIYAEFVAVYLELKYFAGTSLPRYFPAIEDFAALDQVLAQDVDAPQLFLATRPAGAPDPQDYSALGELSEPARHSGPQDDDALTPLAARPAEKKYHALLRAAQRAARLGNVVGGAIYRARAQRVAPPEFSQRTRIAAQEDIHHLAERLTTALGMRDHDPQPWHEALLALLRQAPRGIWTAEARLLYDLQKVCVDSERDLYAVDLVEWVLSWARRPLKRAVPHQRDVLMCKHLRSALGRLAVVRLPDGQRQELSALLRGAIERVEHRVRFRCRPLIAEVLDDVGLKPQNVPETVARKKLSEELLDQVVEYGFFNIGHLRDALSRNQLKLPDIVPKVDLPRGDPLLRADRRLAVSLDGVYHRAEFYLRWLQRFSSVGYGTRFGRLLTRFLVVPFGGAFLSLYFLDHMVGMFTGAEEGKLQVPVAAFCLTGVLLGLFLVGLINARRFRSAVAQFFAASFRLGRKVLFEWPLRVIRLPLVQRFLRSRFAVWGFRFLLKPLLFTAIVWQVIPKRGTPWQTTTGMAISLFLTMNLLLNSRVGRNLQEVIADRLVQAWQRYGIRLLSGLFYLVIDIFRGLLEWVERLLYTVDEWLRFRSGQSRMLLVTKAILGFLWFYVTYVIRFAINVLIEPQINPIKHFPVVTVSHKVLWLGLTIFAHMLQSILQTAFGYTISEPMSLTLTASVLWVIPGAFGFLVWELRENWLLYAANRPERLRAVRIGRHGESMARLLKPGFHSGTIPKRYAKLRGAERKARSKGNWNAARKHLEALRRIALDVRRYVERELLALLSESDCWRAPPVSVDDIALATDRVRIDLRCEGLGPSLLRIAFDAQAGWLVAGILEPGWSEQLLPHQRQALAMAIVGFYKSGGADLVRQQVASELPAPTPPYALCEEGLVVWPDPAWEVEVSYRLRNGASIAPRVVSGVLRRQMPVLERSRVVFREVSLSWRRWVEIWEEDRCGRGHPALGAVQVPVLPAL